MFIVRLIASLFLLAVAGYFLWNVWRGYAKAEGSVWQRLLAANKQSATILVSAFASILAGIASNLDWVGDLIGQPQVGDYLQTLVGNPKTVGVLLVGLSLLTVFARNRTL